MLTGFDRAALPSAPNLVGRVWARDDSLWPSGQDKPSERLGWLHLPDRMRPEIPELEQWAGEAASVDVDTVALLGMGGSSLAPELFAALFAPRSGYPELVVMDSTHPRQIQLMEAELDLNRTLFVVSSKSGGTVETISLYRHFRDRMNDGSRFVAITDRGSRLSDLAHAEGFGRVFFNPPDIGGRYSALSMFGLVPAALGGTDVGKVLERAQAAVDLAMLPDPLVNDGLALGLTVADWVQSGADKVVIATSPGLDLFADWAEQLLAESTGKDSKGVVPIVRETAVVTSDDRRVAEIQLAGDGLRGDGPSGDVKVTVSDVHDIGAHIFVWEFATAVIGALIEVNPFDQPNVEAAKRAASAALGTDLRWPSEDPADLFEGMTPPDYAALLAFAPSTDSHKAVIDRARRMLSRAHGVATVGAFGPRYLHSSGQLYKGGPATIRALIILDPPVEDLPIPGSSNTFGQLITAQAAGDADAMRAAGRRVSTTTWDRFADWVERGS